MASACPISPTKIDEHVARLNGALTLTFIILGLIYTPIFWYILVVDFALRSFAIQLSPIARTSKLILASLKIEPKPIPIEPKKFSAKLGLIFSILLVISNFTHVFAFYEAVLLLFSFAVSLESIFNFCLGCKIYSVLLSLGFLNTNTKIKRRKRKR